jgi:aminoglycoside phosphotransferase (APT) family kinase protein
MIQLDASNAAEYLIATGRLEKPAPVWQLAWGVSNIVLWVDAPDRPFVLKQSRAQLRTREPWFSRLERVYREADAMQALRPVLGPVVPEVLFEDRENYVFAMAAAPTDAKVWKQILLGGHADPTLAQATAEILAKIHQTGARNRDWQDRFGDQTNFYELRLEPYYIRLPLRFPNLKSDVDQLVATTTAVRRTLVHADFSPKNMLVHGAGLVLVDYETVHFGDPAFDLGFFLAHLSLKAIYHVGRHGRFLDLIATFWRAYLERVDFEPAPALVSRGLLHLAGNLLVRIDGTSPVDYLADEPRRECGRAYAHCLFEARWDNWKRALDELGTRIDDLRQFGLRPARNE